MHSFLIKDKKAFGASAKVVAGWDVERIIPCHGDVIEGKAKSTEAWTTLYANLLK